VHPLGDAARRVAALRCARPGLAFGRRDGRDGQDSLRLCRLLLRHEGRAVEGVVVSVPALPHQLLEDQDLALRLMRHALAHADGGVRTVGLGSLLAVVAGRGVELQRHLWQPVTTGAAATAWAAAENSRAAARALGIWPRGPIALLGYGGTVGRAVAEQLQEWGIEDLRVVARGPVARRAARADMQVHARAEGAVASCPLVVGAATTGGILDPAALRHGAVLLDVAIPPTLSSRPPAHVRVLAGEALQPPGGYRRGLWGRLYHLMAGYGPQHLFACLAEPLLMALFDRREPFAQGRFVKPEALRDIRRLGTEAGFRPVLARRWRTVTPDRLGRRPRGSS